MSNLHPQTEMKLKEELYEIYYSISQILNIRTESETQEMIDKIQQSDPFQILNYIRELISILVKTTRVTKIKEPNTFENEERRQYENTLRKYKYFTNKQCNQGKKCSIESHLNFNPGTFHNKNLKYKKMPFQMISSTKNLSTRNSISTKQTSKKKKIILSNNRNSNGLVKPSASFG